MNSRRSTRPEPAGRDRDQRPLVLLAIGLVICLLVRWQAIPGVGRHRLEAERGQGHYLWLSGGSLEQGLYLLPATVTLNRLYALAAITPPAGGLASTAIPDCAALTLRDRSQPLVGPMANTARPLFFRAIAVNTADRDLLATVPGIGPALADRIVQCREQRGGFARPEDLLEVKGIGPARLEKFRPFLQFGN